VTRELATLVVVGLTAASLALTGCARPGPDPSGETHGQPGAGTGWRALPEVPLSPRQHAVGLWTGREVLLVGGSDEEICPPNADCRTDPTPRTDGVAYDPATGAWRPIAPAPTPLLHASAVMVGRTAYFLQTDRESTPIRRLVAYDVADDRWRTLPVPGDDATYYHLVAAGDRLVALSGTDESTNGLRPGPDLILDPARGGWRALPEDPLGPAFDRDAAWVGGELIVFEHKLVPNPGADGPSLVRSAALNPDTGAWRRLGEAPMLHTGPWHRVGSRLVNPSLGSADGGEVGNWGRDYPNGGALDPATGRFTPLPAAPRTKPYDESAGVLTADSALFVGSNGLLLDATADTWITIPSLPDGDGDVLGRTTVAMGTDMFVFGGGAWPGPDGKGKLINSAWLWSPRGRPAARGPAVGSSAS
jgi:hypothetical protein